MKSKELIQSEINAIITHETKLYSYLYDLVYLEWSDDVVFLERIYSDFLDDDRSEIKRVSIYALLFSLQSTNNKYKEIAIKYIQDTDNDSDLRSFSISGLASAYANSKDSQLLSLFNNIYLNENEEEELRMPSFTAMMKIIGLSSVEILRKNKNALIFSMDDINEDEFDDELKEIKLTITAIQ